jgi:hypothetical protein
MNYSKLKRKGDEEISKAAKAVRRAETPEATAATIETDEAPPANILDVAKSAMALSDGDSDGANIGREVLNLMIPEVGLVDAIHEIVKKRRPAVKTKDGKKRGEFLKEKTEENVTDEQGGNTEAEEIKKEDKKTKEELITDGSNNKETQTEETEGQFVRPAVTLQNLPLISLYMCPRCVQASSEKYSIYFGNHYHQTLVICSRCSEVNRQLNYALSI